MSQEQKILEEIGLFNPKIINWLNFKKLILENGNIRSCFDQQILSTEQFKKKFTRELLSKVPSLKPFVKQKSILDQWYNYYQELLHFDSPIKVKISDYGLGIFSKHKVHFNDGDKIFKKQLFGELVEIEEDDFSKLSNASYPSLYACSSKHYILIGPLSLINHRCKIQAGFTRKQKLHECYVCYAQIFDDIDYDEDEEILVNYTNVREPGTQKFDNRNCDCTDCRVLSSEDNNSQYSDESDKLGDKENSERKQDANETESEKEEETRESTEEFVLYIEPTFSTFPSERLIPGVSLCGLPVLNFHCFAK